MSKEHHGILWIAEAAPSVPAPDALRDEGVDVELAAQASPALIPGRGCIVFDHPFSETAEVAECSLRNPDVPIVVLEKAENSALHAQYLRAGASVVLFDPLEPDVVAATVRALRRFRRTVGGSPLQAMAESCRDLLDAAPCFLTVQDRDLRIVASNARFREAFGPGLGRFCHEAYKGLKDPCEDCPILKTFETGVSHQVETVVTTRAGEEMNVLVWTSPIRDDSGRVTHVMEMATDITRLRKLQDHVTSLGMMLGSMSHGVKGLLMSLDAGIYKVDSGLARGDDGRLREGWGLVKGRIGHIRKMVLDILYYSKPRPLEPRMVDVREFLEELVLTAEPRAREQRVELALDVVRDCGEFEVDRHALFSALLNFLDNAVDACRMAERDGEGRVVVKAERADRIVTISIADNGIGMDQATIDKMFSLFFSSKGVHGTGIGMYVADYIIGAHNGDIEVVSAPNRGTTCIIDLPAVFDGNPPGGDSDLPGDGLE
ncbi:MAG TPA: histidine kinase [Desulfomicrobium sp.]|nr:histidine kinase [Desulfomicrobium sp.]